jgi:peptide/nickel transport system substrate-binding protein
MIILHRIGYTTQNSLCLGKVGVKLGANPLRLGRKLYMRRHLMTFALVGAAVAWSFGSPAHAQGTLRVALPSNLNTLDPAKTKIGEEYIINFLVYSGVTEIDPSGKVKPDLAESWSASEDQQTWTFKLRSGVKFHHGREVDAEDVKTTVERVMDKTTGSTARVNFDIVESVEAIDKTTVRFKLKIPYSGFAEILGDRQLRVVPRDRLEKIAFEAIGSGPFKLAAFKPGDRIELTKNADYFLPGSPKLDGIIFRIMPETAAQSAALETGAIDLVWNLPPDVIDQFKKNNKVVIDSVPTTTWDGLIMNSAQKPFDDVRVRRAVSLAIDKPALVELSLFGHGTPTHTMIPPGHPYYNDAIKIGTDIAQAKKLLTEAGYPNGFETTIYVPSGRPTRERVGLGASEMLKAIGIKAELQRVPWDKFVKDIEGKAAFYTDGFYSRPTIDTSIYPWYHSTGSWNTTLWNYKNPGMDKVLDAARGARTEADKAKFYKEFQALATDEPAGVIPYVLNHVNAYGSNVKNFKSNPMMWLDLRETTIQ